MEVSMFNFERYLAVVKFLAILGIAALVGGLGYLLFNIVF